MFFKKSARYYLVGNTHATNFMQGFRVNLRHFELLFDSPLDKDVILIRFPISFMKCELFKNEEKTIICVGKEINGSSNAVSDNLSPRPQLNAKIQ